MMRVTVEIVPLGYESRARDIATIQIWNLEEGMSEICTYGWDAKLDTHEAQLGGVVEAHNRADGWYPLVERVCRQIALQQFLRTTQRLGKDGEP